MGELLTTYNILGNLPQLMDVNDDWIDRPNLCRQPIFNFFFLSLIGTEYPIPTNKDPAIVLIEILQVRAMDRALIKVILASRSKSKAVEKMMRYVALF